MTFFKGKSAKIIQQRNKCEQVVSNEAIMEKLASCSGNDTPLLTDKINFKKHDSF